LKKTLILSEADLKRKCRLPGLSLALEILPQDELMGKTNFGIEAVMDLVLKIRAYKPEDIKPTPLVTGADLIQMGLTPGPTFTEILDEIETLQLNGEIDRETALKRIQEKYVLVTRETLTEIPVPYGEV
jgi:poly(A) polymerase